MEASLWSTLVVDSSLKGIRWVLQVRWASNFLTPWQTFVCTVHCVGLWNSRSGFKDISVIVYFSDWLRLNQPRRENKQYHQWPPGGTCCPVMATGWKWFQASPVVSSMLSVEGWHWETGQLTHLTSATVTVVIFLYLWAQLLSFESNLTSNIHTPTKEAETEVSASTSYFCLSVTDRLINSWYH